MDLPGLGLEPSTAPTADEQPTTTVELVAGSEWRFEVAMGSSIEVKLTHGMAELFGTELAPNQTYTFTGTKAAIFSWEGGSTLAVTGTPSSDYVAEETPMTSYANLHFALEAQRAVAAAEAAGGSRAARGPCVMLVGPDDSGKTALAKLLVAYATRSQGRPTVVNLNPREGMLSLPGTLSAATFESILDVEAGWGSSPLTGPSPVPVKLPLVYWTGGTDAMAAPERFRALLARLALAVRHRADDDPRARATGVIIDTPGALAGAAAARDGYSLLRAAATEFRASLLVVLGSERLHSGLQKYFPAGAGAGPAPVTLVRLDRSGGCVERDAAARQAVQDAQVRAYFFGRVPAGPALAPHTLTVPFVDVTLYQPRDAADAVPHALMPGGVEDLYSTGGSSAGHAPGQAPPLERVAAPFPAEMQGALLAVLQADAGAGVDVVLESSVLGFLYVLDVDSERGRLKVLSPMGGRVPRKAIVWGRGVETGAELMG